MIENRISALRTARGWSLEDLARRTGRSNQILSSVERRGDALNLGWAKRLAEAFGVPAEDVIGAGLDEDLMRGCLVKLFEIIAQRNKPLPPPTLASVAVLMYQELRQIADPEERKMMLPVIARALYAQAAGGGEGTDEDAAD